MSIFSHCTNWWILLLRHQVTSKDKQVFAVVELTKQRLRPVGCIALQTANFLGTVKWLWLFVAHFWNLEMCSLKLVRALNPEICSHICFSNVYEFSLLSFCPVIYHLFLFFKKKKKPTWMAFKITQQNLKAFLLSPPSLLMADQWWPEAAPRLLQIT